MINKSKLVSRRLTNKKLLGVVTTYEVGDDKMIGIVYHEEKVEEGLVSPIVGPFNNEIVPIYPEFKLFTDGVGEWELSVYAGSLSKEELIEEIDKNGYLFTSDKDDLKYLVKLEEGIDTNTFLDWLENGDMDEIDEIDDITPSREDDIIPSKEDDTIQDVITTPPPHYHNRQDIKLILCDRTSEDKLLTVNLELAVDPITRDTRLMVSTYHGTDLIEYEDVEKDYNYPNGDISDQAYLSGICKHLLDNNNIHSEYLSIITKQPVDRLLVTANEIKSGESVYTHAIQAGTGDEYVVVTDEYDTTYYVRFDKMGLSTCSTTSEVENRLRQAIKIIT